MHLDHAVYNEIEESREQGINDVRLLYKLNLDGKVAALTLLCLMTLPAMVLAKAGFRPQNRCTGYPAREKQGKDLLVDEAACRARIFVQVNSDFFRRAGPQHTQDVLVSAHPTSAIRCRQWVPKESRVEEIRKPVFTL
jgi:hypothetical protein